MPATITRLVAKPLTRFDELTGARDVEYIYEGLAPGNDIFNEIGLPPLDHAMRVKNTDLFLTSYDHEEYVDALGTGTGSGKVTCHYEAESVNVGEDFLRWEFTYKKDSIRLPTFTLQTHFYVPVGQSSESFRYTWVEQGLVIPIEYSVLAVTVQRISHDLSERSAILGDMAAAAGQIGHLHVFPQFGPMQWVMQPFQARQADPYRVELTYTWVSDPGNGPPKLPTNATQYDREHLHFPKVSRKPWQVYQVIPSDRLDDAVENPPKIVLVDLYPQTLEDNTANPYFEPAGYKKLPGKPMG